MTNSAYGRFFFRDSSTILLCLHLSLFLFMASALIYFFKISHAIFYALIWWIPIIIIPYMFLTVAPIFHPDMLWYTPFSPLALRVYLGFPYALFQASSRLKHFRGIFDCMRKYYHDLLRVCSRIKNFRGIFDSARKHYHDLRDRYSEGFFEGRTKSAKEVASKPSSIIDTEVVEMTLRVLDGDHALEAFFHAIPGFCDSKLVKTPLHSRFTAKLQQSLIGFLNRTFSSHLVTESTKSGRLITCLNAAQSALGPSVVSQILGAFFDGQKDEALKTVELGHCLRRWGRRSDDSIDPNVRRVIACIVAHPQDRNDRWTMLVKEVFGVPDGVFQAYLPHGGDSVLLAILIHITREGLRTGRSERGVLESLSQFDIRDTVSELQHEFCTLWNEIVQEARNEGANSTTTQTLAGIRCLFSALHQGTNSAPIRFSASPDPIDDPDAVLSQLSSYPSCDVPGHRPLANSSTPGLATTSPSGVLGSLPTPMLTPAISSHTSFVFPSSMDSALTQIDYVPHTPGVPSSNSPTGPWSTFPHVTTASAQYPGVNNGAAGSQDGTQDARPFIPREDNRQSPPGGSTGL